MNTETQANSAIYYEFSFSNGRKWHHQVNIQAPDVTNVRNKTPEWTNLAFHQCEHCPLTGAKHPQCPFALALAGPVAELSAHKSHELVDVSVRWRGRETRQTTSIQRAAGSLLGAIGATSGCPHTRLLKAMAWFHQPFSTSDESLYRILSTYLLGQFLKQKRGREPDWELRDLKEMYRTLRQVNKGMSNRLRAAAEQDSSVNGLILLDLLAADTLYSLERYNGALDKFFAEYFDDTAGAC